MPSRPRGRPGRGRPLGCLGDAGQGGGSAIKTRRPAYWTEAVRAAEGSEKLVGVLAEAVITMSEVVGPLAVAPGRRGCGRSGVRSRPHCGPRWNLLGGGGCYGRPGRGDRGGTGGTGAGQPGVGDGVGLSQAFPRMLNMAIDTGTGGALRRSR